MIIAILLRYTNRGEGGHWDHIYHMQHDYELMARKFGVGLVAIVTETDAEKIVDICDGLILPGSPNMIHPKYYGKEPTEDDLRILNSSPVDEYGYDSKIIDMFVKAGKPIFGLCLGMQMLFEKSYEYGEHEGLGLLKGSVVPMQGRLEPSLKIPQIGWNKLRIINDSPLFKYINNGDHVYFVHSYYAVDCEDSIIADTEYGAEITAAVAKNNVYGCQFHPEKSGEVGLNILRGFLEV